MTGTGMVIVAGVGAGVGVAVGVGLGVAVAVVLAVTPLTDPPPVGDVVVRSRTNAEATLPLSTAPAMATPPAARKFRLLETADRMWTAWAGKPYETMTRCVTESQGDRAHHEEHVDQLRTTEVINHGCKQ
jgi:hypothetical protein